MTRFAIDSSCMIAAVCSWHEHHKASLAAIERRFARGHKLAVAAHAILESYAVLTRLPAPNRLAPVDAWTAIKANFVDQAIVVSLDGEGLVRMIDGLVAAGTSGGRSYDALIAACAARAKAAELLTLNPRHFDPPPDGVLVVDPAAT